MTRRPICPACGSDQVTPDSTNGGAGRNRCAACGHVATVREFYPDSYLASAIRDWPKIVARHVNYVTEPVAAVLMPDGTLNDMRPHRPTPAPTHPPAPIRQYKDDTE